MICHLLGVDADYHDQLMAWWGDREALLMAARTTPDLSQSNYIETKIREFPAELAAERIRRPRDDMISYLVRAEMSGPDGATRPLTLDEVGEYCRGFFVTGSATTTHALSWAAILLARRAEGRGWNGRTS